MTVNKITTMKEVQNLTNAIDKLQEDLEKKPNPITAMLLSQKYSELENLSFEYDVFNKELIFIF